MNVKHLTTRPGLSWFTMSDLICLKVKIKSSPRLSLASHGQWQLLILIYCDKVLGFCHTWMQYWKQAKRAALATAWLKVQRLVFSERFFFPLSLVLYLSRTQHMEGIQIQEYSSIYFFLLQVSMQYMIHTHMGEFQIYICKSFFQGSMGREGCPVVLAMLGNYEDGRRLYPEANI